MLKIFRVYSGLTKNMYMVCLAQLVNKLGTFVLPFLAIYLTQKKGLNVAMVGFTMTAILCCSLAGSITGGKFADKFGRKKSYMIFQSIAGILLIPCAFIDNSTIFILLIGVSNFAYSAVVPTISAMVADILEPEQRQSGYSFLYLCSNVGTILGPVLGALLYKNYTSLIFIGDGVTCLIAVCLVMKYVNGFENHEEKNASVDSLENDKSLVNVLSDNPHLIMFFGIFIIYTMVYTQQTFALPLTLTNIYKDYGTNVYGYVSSASAIIVCAITAPITFFTKKFDPLVNILFSGILFAVGFGMIGFIKVLPLFFVSTFIWTSGEILLMNNINVFIANNTPRQYMARMSSLISVSWSLGSMIGTSFLGKYINLFGITSMWIFILVLSLIGSAFVHLLHKYVKKSKFISAESSEI